MEHKTPTFVGRRQTRLDARIAAQVRTASPGTVGGISLRYDEQHHYDLELQGNRVVARAVLPGIQQEQDVTIADGTVVLAFELRAPARGSPSTHTCDLIDLVVTNNGNRQVIATLDGRYLSMENTCSFTGRVAGPYCRSGRLQVDWFEEVDL